jgi:hypothetical protein
MDIKQACSMPWKLVFPDGYPALEFEFINLVSELGMRLQETSFRNGVWRLVYLIKNGELRRNRDLKTIKLIGDGELFELRFSCLSFERATIGARLFCVLDPQNQLMTVIGVHAKTDENSESSRGRQNAAVLQSWSNYKARSANGHDST